LRSSSSKWKQMQRSHSAEALLHPPSPLVTSDSGSPTRQLAPSATARISTAFGPSLAPPSVFTSKSIRRVRSFESRHEMNEPGSSGDRTPAMQVARRYEDQFQGAAHVERGQDQDNRSSLSPAPRRSTLSFFHRSTDSRDNRTKSESRREGTPEPPALPTKHAPLPRLPSLTKGLGDLSFDLQSASFLFRGSSENQKESLNLGTTLDFEPREGSPPPQAAVPSRLSHHRHRSSTLSSVVTPSRPHLDRARSVELQRCSSVPSVPSPKSNRLHPDSLSRRTSVSVTSSPASSSLSLSVPPSARLSTSADARPFALQSSSSVTKRPSTSSSVFALFTGRPGGGQKGSSIASIMSRVSSESSIGETQSNASRTRALSVQGTPPSEWLQLVPSQHEEGKEFNFTPNSFSLSTETGRPREKGSRLRSLTVGNPFRSSTSTSSSGDGRPRSHSSAGPAMPSLVVPQQEDRRGRISTATSRGSSARSSMERSSTRRVQSVKPEEGETPEGYLEKVKAVVHRTDIGRILSSRSV
jgi:hypothetical protein